MKLNAKLVEKLLKTKGRYHDGFGLYLQVTGPGRGSWLLRYKRGGREHMHGLGPVFTVGLAEARMRARAARLSLLDGVDPIDQRQNLEQQAAVAAAKAMTFAQAARAWHTQQRAGWRSQKHADQAATTLETYAIPVIGHLPIAEIDTTLVLQCVEPIWQSKTETASRLRGRIEAVLDWATVRGYRTGDNPARWRGHLQHVLPAKGKVAKPEHHAALPYTQIAEFMADLRKREGVDARALEFLILTAARTQEGVEAKWSEIDPDTKIWTVPAGRMKAGEEHRVPLSDQALEILQELPHEDGNDFIFIGAKGHLSNAAMARLLHSLRPGLTVHGFRSTFKDWATEQTAFPNFIAEKALAHTISDKVEAAYQRADLLAQRRKLMDAWASYCTPQGDNVIPLRRAQ